MNKDPNHPSSQTELIGLLINRLERISADSYWAHRASGIRGALLGAQTALARGEPLDNDGLQALMVFGFKLLERAAREKRARSN
jgi:hypothetical protein